MTDVSFLAGTHLMESFAHVKGRVAAPNQMNFRKSVKRGEGSFSIQNLMLQILGTSNRAFWA